MSEPILKNIMGEIIGDDRDRAKRIPGTTPAGMSITAGASCKGVDYHSGAAEFLLDILARQAADLIEYEQAGEEKKLQKKILGGINRILQQALICETEGELGKACLEVARGLTASADGFIGAMTPNGCLEVIAISDPLWDACPMTGRGGNLHQVLQQPHCICGRVLLDGKPVHINDPAAAPDGGALTEGHPSPDSFLGVPLKQDGEISGIIVLANKKGGYSPLDVETVEALTPAINQAMLRITSNRMLRQSEERFRVFVTACSDVVYRMSPDWSKMYYLRDRDSVPDTCRPDNTWLDKYIHPDDQPRVTGVIKEAIRTKGVFELEHRVRRVDGTRGWISSRAVPMLDSAGEIMEWFGTAKDVTARREAQEKTVFQVHVLESMHDAVCATDENYIFTYWNKVAEEMFGWTAREAIGRCSTEIFGVVAPASARKGPIKGGPFDGCTSGEVIYQRKDGRDIYVDEHARQIRGPGGECKGYVASLRDITVRKQMEAALRESEERYRTIFETAAEGIVYSKYDGPCLYCNQQFADMLGYALDEIPGKWLTDLSFTGDQPYVRRIRRALKKGEMLHGEFRFRRKDGSELWTMFNGAPVFSPTGEHIANFAMHTDITRRKRAEAKLRKTLDRLEEKVTERTRQLSQERQRLFDILETLPVNICLMTADYRIPFANRTFRETFGEPDNRYCYDFVFGLSEPCGFCQSNRLLEIGKPHHWETEIPGGRIIDVYDFPFTDTDGSRLILEMSFDVTERENTIKALRQSEERFAKIFYNSPVLLGILRVKDNSFIDVNQKFIDSLEYSREEVLGKTPKELNIWAEDAEHSESIFCELKVKGEIVNSEYRLKARSGKIINVQLSAVMTNLNDDLCLIVSMVDVTREKKLEADMFRLDRLNLVGEMAAGIGHEVRNPMTTVRGFLQLLGGRERYARDKEYFDLMIDELDRANSIISEFLSLAKNRAVNIEIKNLNKILNSILPLIQSDGLVTDKYVELKTGDISDLLLDEKEMRQLVINLVRNGLQAMRPGKTLTIETYMEENSVVLAVKDQGSGIPAEIIEKIGAPFFTTKDTGTGLGLAVCYSIAAKHNATIGFETCPSGTTFFVRFDPMKSIRESSGRRQGKANPE